MGDMLKLIRWAVIGPFRSRVSKRNSRSAPTRQGGCSANSFVTRVSKIGSKDRQRGIIGKVKEVAGKVLGDAKLESEGKADQAAGQVQNAVGGLKDTLRGK
jgi:uncharacterized protein YjbJ (UPF0337 family)